ncbi:MAG: MFS transporter [Solirubrobacterales bacterium]
MGALRHRDFRLLWAGQTVSTVGDALNIVALAVFALEHGYGPSGLGAMLAARTVAMILFLPLGGIVGDRMSRRGLMIAADAVRGVAIVGLALVPASTPLVVVSLLAFLVGAGQSFFQPAYGALMPAIVPTGDLVSANSLTAVARQGASVLGPAVGGGLIALVGVRWALAVDATTYAASIATLVRVREPRLVPRPGATSVRRDIGEGIAAVRARPWIALVIGMAMIQLLFVIGPWEVLLPVIARRDLGGNGAFALILSVYAAGAVCGALAAARIRTRVPGVVALLAIMAWPPFFIALIGPAPVVVVAALAFAAGVGEEIFEVLWTTALQRDVPGDVLARVISLDYLGSYAFMPIGLALAGPATDAFGADAVLIAGAVVATVTTLPLLAVRSVRRLSSH